MSGEHAAFGGARTFTRGTALGGPMSSPHTLGPLFREGGGEGQRTTGAATHWQNAFSCHSCIIDIITSYNNEETETVERPPSPPISPHLPPISITLVVYASVTLTIRPFSFAWFYLPQRGGRHRLRRSHLLRPIIKLLSGDTHEQTHGGKVQTKCCETLTTRI